MIKRIGWQAYRLYDCIIFQYDGGAVDYLSHGNDHFLTGYNDDTALNTSTDDFDLMKYALEDSQDFSDIFSAESAPQRPHPQLKVYICYMSILIPY